MYLGLSLIALAADILLGEPMVVKARIQGNEAVGYVRFYDFEKA